MNFHKPPNTADGRATSIRNAAIAKASAALSNTLAGETSSKGIPKRADKVVETTLRNNSAPPGRNRLPIQSTLTILP
ncbi:Uncharacterised protein [Neisseria meningitidis]|nr:Uncharacterised protein [Neisseria meningitidis]CWM44909.1 Uncharacterised protein [Neisseria meningitidis]CWN81276.1 Uncharacterised protein [Neisseria meningitidis]CWN85413.1 Uncharacterised protein [Neisseria meningitidis]CWP48260.1 Uncharacterised protein [Neisseria meningitidis]